MTKEITSIGFSDKEYAKALERLLNDSLELMYVSMKASFQAKEYVNLNNHFILAYTSNNAERNYFIYSDDIDEENPQKAEILKEGLGNNWLGSWPSSEQIKLISRLSYNSGDFICSESSTGNCAVLSQTDNGEWIGEDFTQRPARPVSVLNLNQSELKSVLLYLLRQKFVPYFDSEESFKQAENISDLISKLDIKDNSSCRIKISADDLKKLNISSESEIDKIIKKELLNSIGLEPGFTSEQVKDYLKKSDFIRAQIPVYDEGYFSDETQWLWDFWPQSDDKYKVEIPSGLPKIRSRNPREDINTNSVIAIDFGTSSTVVVEYDPRHPDKPRQICVGSQTDGKYENPTLMLIKKYGAFLASYYGKECRPYTKWDDLMVSHAVKDRMGNAENNEFKAVVSHIKQWAADTNTQLSLKPAEESEPITLKPLSELLSKENSEDFNPIEVYAYFLGLYINNRQEGYGIYLNYQLSYPATYSDDVREYICESFRKGIRKSIPSEIKDEEIKVEMNISEPEAYAVMAMKKYGFEPENDEKVKYAIFDFGGGTSDFAYGYWSRPDKDQKGKEWKIQTIDVNGQQFLGGENILDGLAFEVFSDPRNLAVLKENHCKFSYGIEKYQRNKGVDNQFISNNFYARNNMATLIDWNGATEDGSDCDANGVFGKGLRTFWENQEKYFQEYFSNTQKSNYMMILINELKTLIEIANEDGVKGELQELLTKANNCNNDFERKSISSSLAYLKSQHKDIFENNSTAAPDEYKIMPTLYSQTEEACEPVPNVEIIVSKRNMYKYFCDSINEGINSFFSALKNAFEKDNQYNGSIKIFLAGNSSKSPILRNLMEERIRKESNSTVSFDLFNRFDSDDYEEKLRSVLKAQEWDEEDIEGMISDQKNIDAKFQPTGKTGVAFGIIEMVKGKIQVVQRKNEYFKYYLGDSRQIKGRDRFIPFEGFKGNKPEYPNGDWVATFELPASNEPQTRNLYYTTRAECLDGKQTLDIASYYTLTFPCIKDNEKVFIKAAGVDKIYCVVAIDENDAEEKLNKEPKDIAIILK